MEKLNVLGTEYKIITKPYSDEEAFERRSISGFCDSYAKEIVVCDMHTYDGFEHEAEETIIQYSKYNLRHEITHAFMYESGLAQNSKSTDAWALNEEMIDWIARQGSKLYKAWKEADAL